MSAGCVYCGRPFSRHHYARPTVDHVEPLSRGGEDVPANRVAACHGCNASKNDLLPLEWVWKRAGLLEGGRGRPIRSGASRRVLAPHDPYSVERLTGEAPRFIPALGVTPGDLLEYVPAAARKRGAK